MDFELSADQTAIRDLFSRFCDERFTLIGGGTSAILKLIIAKEISK